MKTVWKYDLLVRGETEIYDIPMGSRVIKVECRQPQLLSFWAEVDTEKNKEKREFVIVGTGHPIPENYEYVGTALDGWYVWHLYEKVH